MSVVALISDLAMQSQVAAAAARAGTSVELAGSVEALLAKIEAAKPRIVILDLSHPGLDVSEVVGHVKQLLPPGSNAIAFGPHVHATRLMAAREAGCDLVMSRGQFHAQMEEILRPEAGGWKLAEEDTQS